MINKYGLYLLIRVYNWFLGYMFVLLLWHTDLFQDPRPSGPSAVAWFSSSLADSIHNFPLVSWGAFFYTPDATPLHEFAINLGWLSPYMTLNIINLGVCFFLWRASGRLEKNKNFRNPWRKNAV